VPMDQSNLIHSPVAMPVESNLEAVPISPSVNVPSVNSPPNSDFFANSAPIVLEPTVTEPNDHLSVDDDEEDGPTTSFQNLIPIDNLKHGFEVVSNTMSAAAQKVTEKANEVYQSEQFQFAKKKTSEAWEKTVEVTTPVWEQTKQTAVKVSEKTAEVTAPVWETTKETAVKAAEKTQEGLATAAQHVKPTMQTVSSPLYH
jgi:hypothetical protein